MKNKTFKFLYLLIILIFSTCLYGEDFYIKEIDNDLFQKINGISYKENEIIPLKDLGYIHILHENLKDREFSRSCFI